MDLGFLDNIWQGIGNIGADTDKFMKREMPFDSGWGAPAAAVAAYFGGPAVMSAMGEGAGSLGAAEGAGAAGGESVLGAGGMNGLLDTLGVSGGGEFMPTAGNSFDLNFLNPSTGMPWSETGSGLTGNGFSGYTPQEQAGLDNLINQQSAKYPMDGTATSKPSFQQLLGKQLMSGGLGNSMGGQRAGYQHQEQPVQRQAAFAATPAPFQVQNKDSDMAALIAALRSKGTM